MRPPMKLATSEPYFVHRTPSSNLPIYLLTKNGGNLKQTKVRKLEGNIAVLHNQLREHLKIEKKEDIKINPLTKHIIIKVRSTI
jgi:large subunit ribosomal protein L49